MSQATPARPYIRRQAEGDTLWFLGSLVTLKATGADTRGRLTVAEFVNPAGFAPPLHRHLDEDEMFYLLSGTAEFRCDGQAFQAGVGDFVLLPVGLPHTFIVGADEPLRVLQITTPSGFEHFAADAGEPASGVCRTPRPSILKPSAAQPPSTPSNCSARLRSSDSIAPST
jgi:mannose-6-phosphate isomerase-like protein (cupin superfamily)